MTRKTNDAKEEVALTEKEGLLLAAGLCVATIAATTPEAFDGIQLNTRLQQNPQAQKKYAEACLLIEENFSGWQTVVEKMRVLHG